MQGIFMSTLKAESYEKKLIKPKDLDIYNEPPDAIFVISHKTPSVIQQGVSVVRKHFGEFSGIFKDGYDKAAGTISTTEKKVTGLYEEVNKMYDEVIADPVILAKPGLVSAAVLVGYLIPGRGRKPFKRLFFSAALGLSVSSACYPRRALDASWVGYEKAKVYGGKAVDYAKEQWNKKPEPLVELIENTEPGITSLSEEDPVVLEEESTINNSASEEITVPENTDSEEAKDSPIIETDLGQSNLEDKDMYSTRS